MKITKQPKFCGNKVMKQLWEVKTRKGMYVSDKNHSHNINRHLNHTNKLQLEMEQKLKYLDIQWLYYIHLMFLKQMFQKIFNHHTKNQQNNKII